MKKCSQSISLEVVGLGSRGAGSGGRAQTGSVGQERGVLWGKERGRASRLEGRLGKLACRRVKRMCTLEKAAEGTPGRRTSEGKDREVGSLDNPVFGTWGLA